jgi:hypothetical protein
MIPVTKKPIALLTALLSIVLLSACNLGAGNAPEPTVPITPPETVPQETDGGEGSTDSLDPPTPDPGTTGGDTGQVGPPPTSTPAEAQALQPSEQIRTITVVSDAFTTNEPITIQVQRGSAVGSIGCSVTLQDTGETEALTGNETSQIDDTTFRETYTYTPTRAGTYAVTCTGLATTAGGQQRVNATSDPFTVEAKG